MSAVLALAAKDLPLLARHRGVLAEHSKSFALAGRLFPPDPREDAAAVYAWCRLRDDAIGLAPMGAKAQALVAERERLARVYFPRGDDGGSRGDAPGPFGTWPGGRIHLSVYGKVVEPDAAATSTPRRSGQPSWGRYAPATANKALSALRGVLGECFRLGLISAETHASVTDLPTVKSQSAPRAAPSRRASS